MLVLFKNVGKLLNGREFCKGYKLVICLLNSFNNIVLCGFYSVLKIFELVIGIKELDDII